LAHLVDEAGEATREAMAAAIAAAGFEAS